MTYIPKDVYLQSCDVYKYVLMIRLFTKLWCLQTCDNDIIYVYLKRMLIWPSSSLRSEELHTAASSDDLCVRKFVTKWFFVHCLHLFNSVSDRKCKLFWKSQVGMRVKGQKNLTDRKARGPMWRILSWTLFAVPEWRKGWGRDWVRLSFLGKHLQDLIGMM